MTEGKRVFSGIQPTGNIHIGNYIGAGRNYVALQEDYETIYCVVDMHAITTWQEPAELNRATRDIPGITSQFQAVPDIQIDNA